MLHRAAVAAAIAAISAYPRREALARGTSDAGDGEKSARVQQGKSAAAATIVDCRISEQICDEGATNIARRNQRRSTGAKKAPSQWFHRRFAGWSGAAGKRAIGTEVRSSCGGCAPCATFKKCAWTGRPNNLGGDLRLRRAALATLAAWLHSKHSRRAPVPHQNANNVSMGLA